MRGAAAVGAATSGAWREPWVFVRTVRSRSVPAPKQVRRRVRNAPSSGFNVIAGVLGVNTAVLGAWWYAKHRARTYGDQRAYMFMMKNFTSGEYNLRHGRWWTLLTACCSHQDLMHFGVNMLTFALTAPALVPIIGAPSLLALYAGAGLAASVTSIAWPHVVAPWLPSRRAVSGRPTFSQGASGSVYAIFSTFAMMQPGATVYLFYAVPLPAWLCIAGISAYELHAAAWPRPESHIDSVGHVGGLLAGVAYALLRL